MIDQCVPTIHCHRNLRAANHRSSTMGPSEYGEQLLGSSPPDQVCQSRLSLSYPAELGPCPNTTCSHASYCMYVSSIFRNIDESFITPLQQPQLSAGSTASLCSTLRAFHYIRYRLFRKQESNSARECVIQRRSV